MLDRFVSYFSLAVVAISAVLFACFALWTTDGSIGQGDGFLAMNGCLLAALVFANRYSDPGDLEPLSVVKAA
jgi:hypothetical protein